VNILNSYFTAGIINTINLPINTIICAPGTTGNVLTSNGTTWISSSGGGSFNTYFTYSAPILSLTTATTFNAGIYQISGQPMVPSWYNSGLNIYLSGDSYNNAACRNINYITQAGISNMNNLTSGIGG